MDDKVGSGRGRGDGRPNPVERLDATLAGLADAGAGYWQSRTPFSRRALMMGFYLITILAGLGYVALTRQFAFLGILFLAYVGSLPGRRRGVLIEEIQLEAVGLPRRTLSYLSVFVLGLGLFGILTSLPSLVAATLGIGSLSPDWPGLVGGAALMALKVGDYIARTTPPDQDGDPERPVERLRAGSPHAGRA